MTCYDRLQAVRRLRNQERLQRAEMIIFGLVIFTTAVYMTANVLVAVRAGRWPV